MIKFKKLCLNLYLLIFIVIILIGLISAVEVECDSCGDCSTRIQSAGFGDIIKLNTSISNAVGNCVEFIEMDNITFDCQGYSNYIDGDGTGTDYGIYLNSTVSGNEGSNNNTIRNCNITGFNRGIYLEENNDNNRIFNITTSFCTTGISLDTSDDNVLRNITASNNTSYGISLSLSDRNNLTNITANGNTVTGVFMSAGDDNIFRNITIKTRGNQGGFFAAGDPAFFNDVDNTILVNGKPVQYFDDLYKICPDNQILDYNNTYSQISLANCRNVTITGSTFTDSIYLFYSYNTTVRNTNSSYNSHGVKIQYSKDSFLENVTLHNNTYGVNINDNRNVITNSSIKNNFYGFYFFLTGDFNTINNSYIEGNEYGVYSLGIEDFFEAEFNTFYDNIINNTDNYFNNIVSTTYFNTTKRSGTNILGGPFIGGNYWGNEFGTDFSDTCTNSDNDGICDSSYSVDANNTDYFPLTTYVLPVVEEEEVVVLSESGGGRISLTQLLEKVSHLWTKIFPETLAILQNFDKSICIEKIQFEVKEGVQNVKITVTRHDEKPEGIKEKVGGVCGYLQIESENLKDNLKKATITIRVEKNWTVENEVEKEDILLFKFNESLEIWKELETNYTMEDEIYYFYETELDSFSYFVIAEKEIEEIEIIEESNIIEILKIFWPWILIGVVILVGLVLVGTRKKRKIKKRKK